MLYKKITSLFIISSIWSISVLPAFAQEFNPNNIISDFEYTNYRAMNLDEIQNFLESKNSYLASYKTKAVDGKIKSAAEIVYRAANEHKISPKFLLVMLQKEQSLIQTANPSDYQLDWATGFARCDDPIACAPEEVAEYQGFAKQVDSAAWRNRFYIENSHKQWLKQINTTYKIDEYEITPVNQATASLYNYTPHYKGNYNFWKIWNRYFFINYPNGTLLKTADDKTVYLIQHNIRHPFTNKASFSSRGYQENKIIIADENDISKYQLGAPIRFPNFTLMRNPEEEVYLLINDKKHKIASSEVFKELGFLDDEVVDLTMEEINDYPDGEPISLDAIYPLGALLRDTDTGGVYYVKNGRKNPIWSREILKSNFPADDIIETEHSELENITNGWPLKFKDGEIIKAKGQTAVYVISNGERRPIVSGTVFEALKYKWGNIIETDEAILNALHPLGEAVNMGQDIDELKDGTLVKSNINPSVYLIEKNFLRPILSGEIFIKLGFDWNNIKEMPQTALNLYKIGETVDLEYMNERELAKL